MSSSFTKSQRQTAFVWAIFGALFFSTKAILAKLMYREGADAIDVLTLRMIFSLPFFVLIGLWARRTQPYAMTRSDYGQVFVVGLFGYYLASLFDFMGLEYISVGLERLILFLTPSLVLIMSKFVLKKNIDVKQWLAMLLAYVGIVLVFVHEVSFSGSNVPLGSALVFASAASYATYLLMTGELVKRLGAMRLVAYAMAVSTVLCVLNYVVVRLPHELVEQNMTVYGYSLLNAVLCTVAPVVLTMMAVARLGSSIVSQISMVGPLATVGLGYVFLGEPITPTQLAGTSLVMVGIFLVGRVATK
ncbi:multidrug DMT transporter permease [Formosimonas limnophila]|uniref:Multidrug DMT transporter permease n=1 Tax=Formosimonas limnophila TaxID=1384487 RepID=A0A8J3G007_9BURK|nr:DMT family transporter [Formosimonas limnophila]GHA64291.1 multidrug DMT transporter permease [Formosimonas limnophila]